MSDWVKDDWDEDEDRVSKPVIKESWEDENIKESWEDEEEAKETWEDEPKPKSSKPKDTKKEAKATTAAKIDVKEMTEEEKKEAQLKSDYQHTQELFGLSKSLDDMSLKTKEEYQDFIARLYARVNVYSGSSLYVEFLEELLKTLCKGLNAETCKKLANQMRILYEQKSNEEKQAKSKDQKPKGKAKARIKMEFDRIKGDFDTFVRDDFLEDGDDDFM